MNEIFITKLYIVLDLAEEVKWTVPGDMRSLNLQERIDLIKQYMETPFEYKGKSAVLLLKKKVLKKKKERAKKPDDDEDGKKIKRRKREVEVTVNELSAEVISLHLLLLFIYIHLVVHR